MGFNSAFKGLRAKLWPWQRGYGPITCGKSSHRNQTWVISACTTVYLSLFIRCADCNNHSQHL